MRLNIAESRLGVTRKLRLDNAENTTEYRRK